MAASGHGGGSQASFVLIGALLAAVASAASAETLDEYRHFREARFAEVRLKNPEMDRQAADIVRATARLVAAAPPRLAPVAAPPTIWRVPTTLPFIYDNPIGPRMVVIPAGEITLGTAPAEADREPGDAPRRRFRLPRALAVGMFPVTFAEFSLYAAATGRTAAPRCTLPRSVPTGASRNWREPGFAQTFRSPATCIGYADAQAYAAWLSRLTGHRYRLLSEAEYEYAARAGTTSAYWWGNDRAAGCALANAWNDPAEGGCDDKAAFIADLGANKPNGFGLFDMTGNVASWTTDCWDRACRQRVVRGASWATSDLRAGARRSESARAVSADLGFRIAREL